MFPPKTALNASAPGAGGGFDRFVMQDRNTCALRLGRKGRGGRSFPARPAPAFTPPPVCPRLSAPACHPGGLGLFRRLFWRQAVTAMVLSRAARTLLILGAGLALAGCGQNGGGGLGDSLKSGGQDRVAAAPEQRSTIWDLFDNKDDPNTTVAVNKYIWNAALDVLNFLPVESVDPFTGVIVFGYGTPPGGGRAYRATVFVQDPALDARSLKVAMQTRGGGAVSAETVRTIEDAILTRARQLRQADSRL